MQGYGNLMNRVQEQYLQKEPVVGDGATITMFSDRHAVTIVEIRTPRKIIVQEDTAIRADKNGMSDDQDYTYSPNLRGVKHTFTKRKHGEWMETGGSSGLIIGERDEYYDFSF